MTPAERVAAATKAIVNPDTIPWDRTVEFLTSGTNLRVCREEMTLRDAVRRFMVLPDGAQRMAGIGLHEPYLTTIYGRPVAVGFMNYDVIGELVKVLLAAA